MSESPRHSPVRRRLVLSLAALLTSQVALADADIGLDLSQRLRSALPTEELEVVISYGHSGPLSAEQVADLAALGIERGVTMRSLPIAGALATPAEIAAIAQRDDVVSIHLNAPLRYFNNEARQLTGAARVAERPQEFNRAVPYSGQGVTVVVNDSGIDATNPDLRFGSHVVENVQAAANLAAYSGLLPISYVEGQPNTDTGSGHGTHCAGTIGGTGAGSNGLHRGVAPGADLVGYGSGGVLLILDAVGGIDYAVHNQFRFDHPIRVVSNSWGSSGRFDPTNPVNIATYEAYKRGIINVFAAGNDGPGEDTHNPYAQAPWVISVGASEKDAVLTDFSSRGKRGESGSFSMPDGSQWTYYNEPTIVAPGVDIISTRALSGTLPLLSAETDAALIAPNHLPYYTVSSGTSMATPHVSGVIALMLEANPDLTPSQVRDLLERTATNMGGRLEWEAGAGHLNAYAAVAAAAGLRSDYGATVNARRSFNANAQLAGGSSFPFELTFLPVGESEVMRFEVGPQTAWVAARAEVDANTVALVLTDPEGNRYGSSITLPLLGSTAVTGGPGVPGTWTLSVRGIGSVSGVALDPLRLTNGYALPGPVEGEVSFLDSAGFTGMDDVGSHPARGAIEYAVSYRLVDGHSDRKFRPDSVLKRSDLARYLVMGANVRQALPLNGQPSFSDLSTSHAAYPFAEAAVASAAPLRDLSQTQDGVIRLLGGQFKPGSDVLRYDLAYALVQSLGLQQAARDFSGPISVQYGDQRITLSDDALIPADLRGYVQLALDAGVVDARFSLVQGPFDLQPTVRAAFEGSGKVTRAAYAVAAGRFHQQFLSATD
ncbi:S8 family peptidase [Pseudomarimonas salicorniae]|uniref:S8 family serine peptidase n=1 Tax=Pseudomarimonas salicorniae TaxID=2933270 RepID=A0ABT0GIL8_9GAMM|nr:S8 family serine peptidase [Lysobacter sp. CAU 1642]MCK7594401.1 S8 family serine peptidase [Lysobacter sp. CAU 1642]